MRPPRVASAPESAGLRLLRADARAVSACVEPSRAGLLSRGVHRAPYLEHGKAVLLAIAGDGHLVKRAIIEPGWEFDVACELEQTIEAYESERPRARLEVLQ